MVPATLLDLVRHSDLTSKFVLLLLLVMSIGCWTLFLYRLSVIRAKIKQLKIALVHLKNIQNFEDLLKTVIDLKGTFGAEVVALYLSHVKQFLKTGDPIQSRISEHEWELIQDSVAQSLDDVMTHEESYLPFLSTSAAAAPLLGLFGTVWGLIHAFVSIAKLGSSDIAAVAPGIAEALITTLAGLIVAIPALVMFSYLSRNIRFFEQQLLAVTDRCALIIRSYLVK